MLTNELDYMSDSPPPDLLPTVKQEADERYEEHPTANTNWFFLNGRLAAFDDARVREAVNYAVDKDAVGRVYGGWLQIGCSFLPPDMAGYDERARLERLPVRRSGRAARCLSGSGADPRGGRGGREVTVWGFDQPPQADVVQAYTEMLNEIGLDAEVKLVEMSIWRQTIGNEETRAQTGIEGLTPSFFHPLAYFTLVHGDAIRAQNNRNTSNVDDPHINRTVDRLEGERDIDEVTGDWADLNRYLVEGLPRALRPPDPRHVRVGADRLRELHRVPPDLPRGLLQVLRQGGSGGTGASGHPDGLGPRRPLAPGGRRTRQTVGRWRLPGYCWRWW